LASLAITVLFSLAGSLDMAKHFQFLFNSTSPQHWLELVADSFHTGWDYFLTYTGTALFIFIGDALLVRAVVGFCASRLVKLTDWLRQVYRCYIIWVEYWWVTILPMITTLSALGECYVCFKSELMLIPHSSLPQVNLPKRYWQYNIL
jgi:hypothetical protein